MSFRPSTAEPAAKVEPEQAEPVAAVPDASSQVGGEPLELTETAAQADAQPEAADAANEELVLGAEAIVATPPKTFSDDAYGAPQAQPAEESRRRWLAPGTEAEGAPAQAAPKVKLGGTLFERMSNAARGASRDEAGEADAAVDIPRFLHRQNNQ